MELVQPGLGNLMNPICANLRVRPTLRFYASARAFCVSALDIESLSAKISKKGGVKANVAKAADALHFKENWLASLSCPSLEPNCSSQEDDAVSINGASNLVIGIDPDLSGALAVLRTDSAGCSAEVFDSPTLKVLVGSRVRRRLDANSIVKLLRSFGAPFGKPLIVQLDTLRLFFQLNGYGDLLAPGTTAFIEQSIPFPQDGKQGWWSGGFGYGLWIGVLVASGFSVIPVSSLMWKNEYELSGSQMCKDDSRKLASTLFPSLSEQLKRKKDHGRAEALLIAAYGNGFRIKSRVTQAGACHADLELRNPSHSPSAHTAETRIALV
ncbi:unnamed protein product [Rhodiola kirilowii]